MILPEWTTINIVLYTMLAILVLGVAHALERVQVRIGGEC